VHNSIGATANSYALLQYSDGTTYLNAADTKNIYFRINNADKMILLSDGNVGIGTTSPNQKLHVVGDIATYKNGSDSVATQLYIANAANTLAYNFQLNSAGTSLNLWTYDVAGWKNSVTFDRGGNVGIGSTSPGYLLDVNGAARFTGNIGVGGAPAASRVLTLTSAVATDRPAIKIVNPNFYSNTSSTGRTFYRWMPIDIDGTTYWIAIYSA
jgi:hypothetical protein